MKKGAPGPLIECPVCGDESPDKDCTCCHGRGQVEVTDCPYERPDFATAREMIAYAELAEKGFLPEPGGLADQVPSFLAAVRYVWSEQRQWRTKLKIGQQTGGCPLLG